MKAQFEKITSPLNSSFNAFIYANDHFDAPWHFHPEYELTYILEGEGIRHVGNSIQQFEKGDFILLGSNLPHCWKNNAQYDGGAKSLVFQWNDDLLGKDWIEKEEFYNIKRLLKSASKGMKFNENSSKIIIDKLMEIVDKRPTDRLLSFIYLLDELSLSNETEILTAVDFSPNLNLKTNYRIDKVYNYVQEHYNKKIRLQDVSQLVSMGNEAFCRFFKKTLNKSFTTFINEYRISMACKLLLETNMQVSQIAYQCGYESLPFFYRQFHKFMNCSPLTYKKESLKLRR